MSNFLQWTNNIGKSNSEVGIKPSHLYLTYKSFFPQEKFPERAHILSFRLINCETTKKMIAVVIMLKIITIYSIEQLPPFIPGAFYSDILSIITNREIAALVPTMPFFNICHTSIKKTG